MHPAFLPPQSRLHRDSLPVGVRSAPVMEGYMAQTCWPVNRETRPRRILADLNELERQQERMDMRITV